MPTYEFKCNQIECNHEWELTQSIKAPDPDICPKCQVKGNITHLISGGSGKGIVELTGRDLINKTKEDAAKYKKELYSSEAVYANAVGESKYHDIQSSMDKARREKW